MIGLGTNALDAMALTISSPRWRPLPGPTPCKAELPGVEKDKIAIDVNGRVLTVKGERSSDNEVNQDNDYRRERSYGRFERSFSLPDGTDSEKIRAEYKDGVLTLNIPKPESSKTKQISVQ